MPVNRNALLRYKAIDHCLQNRRRKWTLDDLIDCVSQKLYEYEGIDKGISRRSIQADIQAMRSSRLGYNAPIVVTNRKYYTYSEPDYSITNIPLNEQDLSRMNEALGVLKQFKGFSHFNHLHEVVQKLEDHVYSASHKTSSVIEFEKNDQLKGLPHLDLLYRSIIQQQALRIEYQSFTARAPSTFIFHAWWLKEFKNRWFVVGAKKKNHPPLTLAVDRIHELETLEAHSYIASGYGASEYYKDVIGVSVSENMRPSTVKIWVDRISAPYVETKPLHHSQQVLERMNDGIIITVKVQLNFELEKEILGFGPGMIVLAPINLRNKLQGKLVQPLTKYEANRIPIGSAEGFV